MSSWTAFSLPRDQFRCILWSFWELFFKLLATFPADAAKVQKSNLSLAKCLFLRRPGFHFSTFSETCFQFLFGQLSGRHFWTFFIDFELKMESRRDSSWRDFGHILHVEQRYEQIICFFSLWGGAGGRGGSPGSLQILKNQTIVCSARPAPPEGGAANLKASPLPPAPLLDCSKMSGIVQGVHSRV